MPKSYIIADKEFSTKTAVTEFIKSILYKYQLNDKLVREDFDFVFELLKRRPDYKDKVGVGVKELIIRRHEKWGNTRCFYVVRTDGSQEAFGYRGCL
ncbi:MAG: DCL family protein [Candidatus Susulua stagnicola]|nr:DCL family protein [Candidatus Susulua stagnicola]